jgi:UDP-GlcNAc:undecaprenyl-phosphate GlcNAc-1-phosphate transferase
MGGIAIAVGIAVGAVLPSLMLWQQWVDRVTPQQLSALVLGTALVFIIGVVDDLIGLPCIQRFLVQVGAAAGVVYAGWSFGHLYVPFWGQVDLGFWGRLVTVVWVVGVTNAINLLDGLDGLAGGVAAIIATSLLIFAWIQGNALTVILMSAIVGACLGFLRYNWAPAKIYMGDSGSLTLGFLLAVMSLYASMKLAAAVAILVPILALGLPVIDTLLVMAVRFVEKPQGSHLRRFARMFQADRNHVHHLMARAAPGRKRIVLVIYFVAACFCLMALVVAVSRSAVLGVALVLGEVVVVFLMRNLGGSAGSAGSFPSAAARDSERFFERA